MPARTKKQFIAPPRTHKELKAIYARVVKKVTAMTPEERIATMVKSGIYTKAGKLTKRYGG